MIFRASGLFCGRLFRRGSADRRRLDIKGCGSVTPRPRRQLAGSWLAAEPPLINVAPQADAARRFVFGERGEGAFGKIAVSRPSRIWSAAPSGELSRTVAGNKEKFAGRGEFG